MGDAREVRQSEERTGEVPRVSDFEVIKVIGEGGYGKVSLVRKLYGSDKDQLYAMKVIKKRIMKKEYHGLAHLLLERKVLHCVKHPFIVELKYAFQTVHKLFFVMEYLGGGDLCFRLDKKETLLEDDARFYAAEILLALEYLHGLGIIYRDLKPENIMIDNCGHVKLIDFGLAKEELPNGGRGTFCGTLEYLAPEIVSYKSQTKGVDWWAFGVLIYDMLTGERPFHVEDDKRATIEKIKEGVKTVQFPQTLSQNAIDIIKHLLKKNPSSRLGCRQSAKSHPFFEQYNWDDVLARKYKPPFIPSAGKVKRASLFDKDFTSMSINSSAGEDAENIDPDATMHFDNFDFVSDEFLFCID